MCNDKRDLGRCLLIDFLIFDDDMVHGFRVEDPQYRSLQAGVLALTMISS